MKELEYYKNLSLENIHYIDNNGVLRIETWKDIPNYIGIYQGSDLGRIKSLQRLKSGLIENKNKWEGRWLKTKILKIGVSTNGYLQIALFKDGIRKNFRVHRLIAETFIPNPDNKPEVNHKKGIKTDNMVYELEWSTHSENQIHAFENELRKPFAPKGEKSHRANLTELQVCEIIKLLPYKRNRDLCKDYNVSKRTISGIRLNQSWKHLQR